MVADRAALEGLPGSASVPVRPHLAEFLGQVAHGPGVHIGPPDGPGGEIHTVIDPEAVLAPPQHADQRRDPAINGDSPDRRHCRRRSPVPGSGPHRFPADFRTGSPAVVRHGAGTGDAAQRVDNALPYHRQRLPGEPGIEVAQFGRRVDGEPGELFGGAAATPHTSVTGTMARLV